MIFISILILGCRSSDKGSGNTINESIQAESQVRFLEETDAGAIDNTIAALIKKHRSPNGLSANEYFELAKLLAVKKEWSKSKLYSAYGVQRDPKSLGGVLCQAEIALREDKIEKAESILKEREAIGQKDASWLNLMAIVYVRSQRYDAAISSWQDASRIAPDRSDIKLNLALQQLQLGRHKEVDIAWLSSGDELASYPLLWMTRATALSQRSANDEALEEYSKFAAAQKVSRVDYNFALSEWRADNSKAARERLEAALKSNDLDPKMRQKIRRLLSKIESMPSPASKKDDKNRKQS